MTTTAEKIKELTINLANLRQQVDELDMQLQELCFSPDPPDPEPLECWIAHQDGNIIAATSGEPETVGRVQKVFMREVTPQDEENEKDAARYRKAKEWLKRSDMLIDCKPEKWDEMIDKAMGSK